LATWHWTARDSANAAERAQTGCRIAWAKPGYGPEGPNATDYQLDSRRAVPHFDTLDHSVLTINLGHAIGDGVGLPFASMVTDEDVTDVFVAMNNLALDLASDWKGGWKLDHLKLAPIGDWGKYPRDCAPHIAVPKSDVVPGTASGWNMAAAFAWTLGTAKRGRGSTGRMFWPLSRTVNNGYHLGSGGTDTTAVATFVEKIANPPAGLDVGRWSMRVIVARRSTLGLTAPYHRGSVVNHIRRGDRVDIQRRRLNKRPETYTRLNVPNLD
jgi:hypothetical protein